MSARAAASVVFLRKGWVRTQEVADDLEVSKAAADWMLHEAAVDGLVCGDRGAWTALRCCNKLDGAHADDCPAEGVVPKLVDAALAHAETLP
jgi:hypothetical protein